MQMNQDTLIILYNYALTDIHTYIHKNKILKKSYTKLVPYYKHIHIYIYTHTQIHFGSL